MSKIINSFRSPIILKGKSYILGMISTFKSKIEYLEKLKMHHVVVTEEVLQSHSTDEDTGSVFNQRFKVTVNGSITWQAGSVSLGNRTAYIVLSKARMKKLGVHLGDEVEVFLERDHSKYGFDVPEEFTEVLNQDDEGRARFESMTMGKQRAIIYLILQIKSSQKKIEKSIFFLENLKRAPKGEETMRHVLGKDLP